MFYIINSFNLISLILLWIAIICCDYKQCIPQSMLYNNLNKQITTYKQTKSIEIYHHKIIVQTKSVHRYIYIYIYRIPRYLLHVYISYRFVIYFAHGLIFSFLTFTLALLWPYNIKFSRSISKYHCGYMNGLWGSKVYGFGTWNVYSLSKSLGEPS